MSTVTSLRIETWGDKFVVVGEFSRLTSVTPHQFNNYGDALRELSKILMREVLRYEAGLSRGIDR